MSYTDDKARRLDLHRLQETNSYQEVNTDVYNSDEDRNLLRQFYNQASLRGDVARGCDRENSVEIYVNKEDFDHILKLYIDDIISSTDTEILVDNGTRLTKIKLKTI